MFGDLLFCLLFCLRWNLMKIFLRLFGFEVVLLEFDLGFFGIKIIKGWLI